MCVRSNIMNIVLYRRVRYTCPFYLVNPNHEATLQSHFLFTNKPATERIKCMMGKHFPWQFWYKGIQVYDL